MNADFRLAFEFRNYPEDDLNYILTDLWREQQNSTFSEDFYLELARGLKQKREKQKKRDKKSLLRRIF
jgi:hypothetical protein